MKIVVADLEHLEDIARLFNHYRIFYQQPSDLAAARDFITTRLQRADSSILVAITDQRMVGFIQLYPSFSSISMRRTWILNDLYVEEGDRRQGVGRLLMQAATEFATKTGALRIVLTTQVDNLSAQRLYESLGYGQDTGFQHYVLTLPALAP